MGERKTTAIEAANEVIVLAFELADAAIADSPQLLMTALKSPQVQESIKKTLLDFAKTRRIEPTPKVSDEEGRQLVAALASGVTEATTDAVLQAIAKTPQFDRLEKSVRGFREAFESSTLGLWVDRNRNTLYVVGAALVIGTASVLYITRTGGKFVDTAISPLKEKQFTVLQVGTLKLKAAPWDFKPDARIFGARVIAVKDWQRISCEGSIGVLGNDREVQQVETRAAVKSGPISVTVSAAGKPVTRDVSLGLGVAFDGKIESGSFSVNLSATYDDRQVGPNRSVEYRSMLTFELRL